MQMKLEMMQNSSVSRKLSVFSSNLKLSVLVTGILDAICHFSEVPNW